MSPLDIALAAAAVVLGVTGFLLGRGRDAKGLHPEHRGYVDRLGRGQELGQVLVNLPDGAAITVGDYDYIIHYTANQVILTAPVRCPITLVDWAKAASSNGATVWPRRMMPR